MQPNLSVIILTHNSEINKGFCLRHCLYSILFQSFENFEIIVVNNNSTESKETTKFFKEFTLFSQEFKSSISTKYIFTKEKITKGNARNLGAEFSKSELLVFIDDDVILIDSFSLQKVFESSKKSNWGFGASRLWTNDNWFILNSENLVEKIKQKDFNDIILNSGKPTKFIRGQEDVEAETISFIGNFGYCLKLHFNKVGGFPNFKSDSFEDDFLTLKLYQKFNIPNILSDITIIHVNHEIESLRQNDFLFYYSQLVANNIFDFDCLSLVTSSEKKPIQQLLNLHFCNELSNAYLYYIKQNPLNISEIGIEKFNFWESKYRLNINEFSILSNKLTQSNTIDEFLKTNPVDFDNIAPLIKALIESNFIKIDSCNNIIPLFNFSYHYLIDYADSNYDSFTPNASINQFPCTTESRKKRLDFIKSRFPYCDFLRISIIGDDDLFSIELKNEFWIYPVIYDTDETILNLCKITSDRFLTKNIDFCTLIDNDFSINLTPKSYTFITDPPYTLNGVLLFIYTGLLTIDSENTEKKEFYVIINPLIMGNNFYQLLKILNDCEIYLYETVMNFSNYNLPLHFEEFNRAKKFADYYNFQTPQTSSTSNLYIFQTVKPNVTLLKKVVDLELVYEHYH